jgi:peptidoglycan/LPS O-acetylase OafA/YrhL
VGGRDGRLPLPGWDDIEFSGQIPTGAGVSERKLEGIEALRGLAALYVFFHHCVLNRIFPGYQYLHFVTKLGQAAVLIFFLISGFVIYTSTAGRGLSFAQYFLLRLRRIYPLFLVALFAAWLAGVIAAGHFFWPDPRELIVNLFLLQDRPNPGFLALPFMDNAPLWSLGYEWCFYMAFMPTIWLTAKRPEFAKYLVCGFSVLGFLSFIALPNQISMFFSYYVIWWAGVEIAREYRDTGTVTFSRQMVSCISIALLGALYAADIHFTPGPSNYLSYPTLQARHFGETLVILAIGFVWYGTGLKGFWALLGWGRYLAPISYGLYVIHMPVVKLAAATHPLRPTTLNIVWVVPLVLLLAWLMERKLQPWINRLIPVRLPRAPVPAAG